MGQIQTILENNALLKDRKIIYNKFKELQAFEDISAVTLSQLGIQIDDETQTKKKSMVKSLYSHFQFYVHAKLIKSYGDKYYFDLKVYKRQQLNIFFVFAFFFVVFIWMGYMSYLNW